MNAPAALVTGSAGFIGRNFTRHLREHGWLVLGIDTADGSDARDFFRARDPWSARPYDLVIHAAAVVGGRQVIETDPLAQAVNFEIDAGLFGWARQVRPGRVIYFSSSAVYPAALQASGLHRRLAEDDVTPGSPVIGAPDALYGWAKLTGEMLAARALADGVAVTVVRPFSGYGPDQDAAYPFPAFTDRALAREDPFLVWGSGSQVRDFVHVDDIVATVMELARLECNGPVNIGCGQPVTMTGLARQVCEAAGYSPQIKPAVSAPAGVAWRVADPARLNRIRVPRVSLEQGIAGALEYRKQFIA
jgi:nucleoside-diphosphate-sugar epimerase